MKNTILAASLFAMAVVPAANSTTVGFSPAPTARPFVTDIGAILASTSLVLVGTFANEAFVFNPAVTVQQNYETIRAAGQWNEFPTSLGTDNYNISTTGKLGGSGTDNSANAAFFNGKHVYVWLFNASTIVAATQMGIFEASNWLFPTNAGGVGDSSTFGTTAATAVNSVGGAGNATTTDIQLSAAVPEPSTALLSVVGLIAMASRRRRNRN